MAINPWLRDKRKGSKNRGDTSALDAQTAKNYEIA